MFRNLLLPLVVVERNPSNLAPGSYNGVVSFAAPPPANSPTTGETIDIPVTLGVTAVQKKILLSQTGLTFTAVVGGDIAPETISVANDGQGVMNFTVRASALSGDYWLSVSPDSGSADAAGAAANLDARIDASRLSPGLYTGQLRVEAPDADNSPQFVTVFLNVLPTNSNPGPTVQPSTLRFTGVAGGAARKDQPAKLIVQPSIAGLTPGVRSGALNIQFSDGSVRTIGILLVLTGGARAPRAPSHTRRAPRAVLRAACCLRSLSLSQDFTATAGWPVSPLQTPFG